MSCILHKSHSEQYNKFKQITYRTGRNSFIQSYICHKHIRVVVETAESEKSLCIEAEDSLQAQRILIKSNAITAHFHSLLFPSRRPISAAIIGQLCRNIVFNLNHALVQRACSISLLYVWIWFHFSTLMRQKQAQFSLSALQGHCIYNIIALGCL